MAHYLGIDIGTSSVKAVIADEAQNVVAESDAALAISRPHPLWSEQNPEDWWHAVAGILDGFLAGRQDQLQRRGVADIEPGMVRVVELVALVDPRQPA